LDGKTPYHFYDAGRKGKVAAAIASCIFPEKPYNRTKVLVLVSERELVYDSGNESLPNNASHGFFGFKGSRSSGTCDFG
jgi:hypothetical protein